MSASGEGLESETAEVVEVVAKVPFIVLGGFGAGRSLLQQSAATRGFRGGGELIMGLLRDSDDSVSVCSKKTYFTARSRARPSVITCSRSILGQITSEDRGLLHRSQ